MARTKPNYRYGSGAYGQRRSLRKAGGGGFSTQADIRAWRGSIQDVARTAEEAAGAIEESSGTAPHQRVALTFSDGTQQHYASLSDFESAALEAPPHRLTAVRIGPADEAPAGDEPPITATVVLRKEFPAVLMSVTGRDRIRVEGLGSLTFQSLMRGYVDDLPTFWRPIVAFSSPLVPFLLVSQTLGDEIEGLSVGLRALVLIPVGVFSIWLLVKSLGWVSWKIPLEFVPDSAISSPSLTERARDLRANRWVVRGVTLAGVVTIGVITNKLSDLVPWP